ncbi:hypothetical protein C8Q78DRAFT_568648 [Trametes maxima]|nr:hypothetical protein C8Q78DRAFT_568648 [Trametes maxima]
MNARNGSSEASTFNASRSPSPDPDTVDWSQYGLNSRHFSETPSTPTGVSALSPSMSVSAIESATTGSTSQVTMISNQTSPSSVLVIVSTDNGGPIGTRPTPPFRPIEGYTIRLKSTRVRYPTVQVFRDDWSSSRVVPRN